MRAPGPMMMRGEVPHFKRFDLVPMKSLGLPTIATRQLISFQAIKLMVSTITKEKMAHVIAKTGKRGLKIISTIVALGAAVSLIKAFENRQIIETFPSDDPERPVDEDAIDEVLERWSERIMKVGNEAPSDSELVQAFIEAFGYDEMMRSMTERDVMLVDSMLPHDVTELHALAFEIQKEIYNSFTNLRKKAHDQNKQIFGALFAPLAEVMEEAAVELCLEKVEIGTYLKGMREGYDLGEKLDAKIHKVVEDVTQHDLKSFVLDIGGDGGVLSILYVMFLSPHYPISPSLILLQMRFFFFFSGTNSSSLT